MRAAALAGFTVTEDGTILRPAGTPLPVNTCLAGYRYRTISLRVLGGRNPVSVPIHRLVAYLKFGEAMFAPGVEVRHRDNDRFNNRPDNILIGTPRENALDIPEEERSRRGRHASKARNEGMTPEERSAAASKASRAHYEKMTPEERNAAAQKASAAFQKRMAESTPEERRANMAKAREASTKYGPEFRATVVADYAMGLGYLRISKLRGCSTTTVQSILRQEGVAIRAFSPAEHKRASAARSPEHSRCLNQHGFPGVSRTRSGMWTSKVRVGGKQVGTGLWHTAEAAHAAYVALKASAE